MYSLRHFRRGLLLAFLPLVSHVSAQQPELLSVDSNGSLANSSSGEPSISADGRFIAFSSLAQNLVSNDTNTLPDVFLKDAVAGSTIRVSVASNGQEANGHSSGPSLCAAGTHVAFLSRATNLAPLTLATTVLVYVHDVQSGSTTLASVDANGAPLQADCSQARISGDGRHVLWLVNPPHSGPTIVPTAWYVRDLQAQTTTRLVLSANGAGLNIGYLDGELLGDGRWIAFTMRIPSHFAGGVLTGRVLLVDRDSDGNGVFDEPGTFGRKVLDPTPPAPFARYVSSSRNGRFITYIGAELGVPEVGLWLHDRDPDGNGIMDEPTGISDLLVSPTFNFAGQSVNRFEVSDDGRFVAYLDHLLMAEQTASYLRVRDMQTGSGFVQNIDASGEIAPVYGSPSISSDGSSVFVATAAALVPGDSNQVPDVYRIPYTTTHCTPVVPYGSPTGNSVYAFGASIFQTGSLSISQNNFTLIAAPVPDTTGHFFYGPAQASVPFGDGLRFVGGGSIGLFRLPIVQGTIGGATFQVDFGVPPTSVGPGRIFPGSQWNFQYVFRDPASGTFGFNTSSALNVTFCP